MKVLDTVVFEHKGSTFKIEQYKGDKFFYFTYLFVQGHFLRLSFSDFMNMYFFNKE